MDELKPCPFCKDEAVYPDLIVEEDEGFVMAWYKCPVCDTAMLGVSQPDEDPRESAIEMAKERWNTRYERTCHVEHKKLEGLPVEVCSECDAIVSYGMMTPILVFCPSCGAKVVEE